MKKSGQNRGWYHQTCMIARKYGIDAEETTKTKKSEWKRMIKEKIKEERENRGKMKEAKMIKLRHKVREKHIRKKYLKRSSVRRTRKLMKMRLEMMDIGNNMGKDRRCRCGKKENIEHLIECSKVEMKGKVNVEWLRETDDTIKMEMLANW